MLIEPIRIQEKKLREIVNLYKLNIEIFSRFFLKRCLTIIYVATENRKEFGSHEI